MRGEAGSTVWRGLRKTQRRSSQDVERNRGEKESRSLTRDLLLVPNISKWGFESEK